jgi:hypothetical protein
MNDDEIYDTQKELCPDGLIGERSPILTEILLKMPYVGLAAMDGVKFQVTQVRLDPWLQVFKRDHPPSDKVYKN